MIFRLPVGRIKNILIHKPRNYYDEINILGEYVAKYAKGKPNKYRGIHPVPRKKIHWQKENNAVVNNVVDEILIHDTQKLSTAKKALVFWDSDYYEN